MTTGTRAGAEDENGEKDTAEELLPAPAQHALGEDLSEVHGIAGDAPRASIANLPSMHAQWSPEGMTKRTLYKHATDGVEAAATQSSRGSSSGQDEARACQDSPISQAADHRRRDSFGEALPSLRASSRGLAHWPNGTETLLNEGKLLCQDDGKGHLGMSRNNPSTKDSNGTIDVRRHRDSNTPATQAYVDDSDASTSSHTSLDFAWSSSARDSIDESCKFQERAPAIDTVQTLRSVEQSSGLRRRKAKESVASDDEEKGKMTSRFGDDETASFLPGGNNVSRSSSAKRTRACLSNFARRRKTIYILCITTFLGIHLYFFAPRLLGEERMQLIDQKFDGLRPLLDNIGLGPFQHPPPPNLHAPPSPEPVATGITGNKVYLPKTTLPPDYDDPIPLSEDRVRLNSHSFPPELAETLFATKPSHLTGQLDADPHLGMIPTVQRQRLSAMTTRKRPPRPQVTAQYPKNFYTFNRPWSAEKNGSRTTYKDALGSVSSQKLNDWRPKPYNSWQPPTLLPEKDYLPRVQFAFNAPDRHSGRIGQAARDEQNKERQEMVKNAFLYAWEAYKAHAWGHDEIRPVTGSPSDSFNGWGATIVDALDTLLVMDLPEEYDLARQHVRDIDFHLLGGSRSAYGSSDGRIPVFETAIRYLGGFLSAYDLSGDVVMRDRAEELAQLILPAFNTLTGIPLGRLRFDEGAHKTYSTGGVILAEAASMLLEMTRLWQVTGNRTYFDYVQRTTDWLDRNMTGTPDRLGALLPTSIFPERGTMYGWYSWGGMIDSAYEYLIKEHQLLGGRLAQYGRMFGEAVDSAREWLIRDVHTVPNAPLLVFGHSNGKSFQAKLEHLACFAGGTMGLGAKLLPNRHRDLPHAERVTETCWWSYNSTTTGIGPEEITFFRDKDADRFETLRSKGGASRRGKPRGSPIVGVRHVSPDYRNRPETIESVFYMWRITGDPIWQERGWQMFCSWVTHGMSNYGFSSILSVMNVPAQHTDSMESFVFAETFKYYYLLFSPPSLVSLDDYVFTTEAHPLLTPKKGRWTQAGHGPRKFWDPAAEHVPTDPSEYSGGEMGPYGGLTHAQKEFLAANYQNQVDALEAERKAKENSLLNTVKINSEHIRKTIQDAIPAGSRLSIEEMKRIAGEAVGQAGARAEIIDIGTSAAENIVRKRDDLKDYEIIFVDTPERSDGTHGAEPYHVQEAEHYHEDHDECEDAGADEDANLYGECLA